MRVIRSGRIALLAILTSGGVLLACGDDDSGGAKRDGLGEGGSGGVAGGGGAGGAGGAGGTAGEQTIGYTDPVGASGTRLQRRYFDAGDGAFQTVELWDTELDTPCTFGTAADGELRCLPSRTEAPYFLDAACTRAVFAYGDGTCSLEWGSRSGDPAYYRRTETPAVMEDATLYYPTESGCQAFFVPMEETIWVAEKVPSTAFVRGTRDDEVRAEGLVARFVDGEDGSRTLLEVVHGTRGYGCTFEGGRCVPAKNADRLYLDSSCTDPVGKVWGTDEPRFLVFDEYDDRPCRVSAAYYHRGHKVEPTEVYHRNIVSGSCTPSRVDAHSYTYYALGTELPFNSFPIASVVREGDGPLTAMRYVDKDGAPLGRVHAFWDATLDERCEPVEVVDGTFACLPSASGWRGHSEYYTDAACAVPDRVFTSFCLDGRPRLLANRDYQSCSTVKNVARVSNVYERGDFITDYYFGNQYVECEPRTFQPPTFGHAPGAVVTSSLPPLELKVDGL